MKFVCINNTDNKKLLTIGKMYEGKRIKEDALMPSYKDWIDIDECDDGISGIFQPFRFIEADKETNKI